MDDEILRSFRERAEEAGLGYQTLINEALKDHLERPNGQPLTESDLRRVLREELLQVNETSKVFDNA
ncbi:MAG: BrnA antitoxin family protein [Pseudanabaenales cyanobacterium]|nr:BrnA antitoxin family protein [Pseudanabaenales cyanobacterium]